MSIFDESKIVKNKQSKSNNSHAVLDEKNVIERKNKKETKKAVIPSFGDISPIVDVTDNDFLEMRNGEFLEILQIETKDIYSLNEMDLQNDISSLTMFLTAYNDNLKIIALNVPMALDRQKRYFFKKMKENKNPPYDSFLKVRMIELENLERLRTSRGYFLFIYDVEEKKLLEKIHQVRSLLSRSNPLNVLTIESKLNILFQLFNPNTKPISE